uniref:Uncharacterized protein n=1 Tax=Eutreptiella gymnastica TaxID=73025 RepID=A0A7S1JBW3_9EUGL
MLPKGPSFLRGCLCCLFDRRLMQVLEVFIFAEMFIFFVSCLICRVGLVCGQGLTTMWIETTIRTNLCGLPRVLGKIECAAHSTQVCVWGSSGGATPLIPRSVDCLPVTCLPWVNCIPPSPKMFRMCGSKGA